MENPGKPLEKDTDKQSLISSLSDLESASDIEVEKATGSFILYNSIDTYVNIMVGETIFVRSLGKKIKVFCWKKKRQPPNPSNSPIYAILIIGSVIDSEPRWRINRLYLSEV